MVEKIIPKAEYT